MDLRLDNRVADIDASSLIKSEQGSGFFGDFRFDILDDMEPVISDHDLLFGADFLVILD